MDVELTSFECGCCGATYTGRRHELAKLGWVSHPYKAAGMRRANGDFLLCRECSKYFEAIWEARRRLAA